MEDQYVGDVGDYFKYSLLRRFAPIGKLGVAWYLYPNESHKGDGKHVDYLEQPERWRQFDPEVFDALKSIVSERARSVASIEKSGLLPNANFANARLQCTANDPRIREKFRHDWFNETLAKISNANVVFADPDNGLCLDEIYKFCNKTMWKRMPVSEVKTLTEGRLGIIYHHNSRFKGGHEKEIVYWMSILPNCSAALRWRAGTSRSFFLLNADAQAKELAQDMARDWGEKCQYFEL